MNHRYIDEASVAERYLQHALAPAEQSAFEAHLAGCEECADRLLLARIFLEKRDPQRLPLDAWSKPGSEGSNGGGHGMDSLNASTGAANRVFTEPLPPTLNWLARFVAQFRPWELVLILVTAAALLLIAPTVYCFWELANLSTR